MQTHEEAKVSKDNIDPVLRKLKEETLNILAQRSIVDNEILAITSKPILKAKENSVAWEKYTKCVLLKVEFFNNYHVLITKLEEIREQADKVNKLLRVLDFARAVLKGCLEKNAKRADIDLKLKEMIVVRAKFLEEYKVLQAKLPLPPFRTLKAKIEAVAKELSNIQSAEGIVDALPKLLVLNNKSFSLFIQLIDREIALSDHVNSFLKQLSEQTKKENAACVALAEQAKQKGSTAPAAGGTLIHVSPKEKPKSGLEVKTGTSPTESPAGSAQPSPPSSPSSSDNGSNRGSPERPGHSPKMYKPSPDTSPKQQATAAPSDPKVACCNIG